MSREVKLVPPQTVRSETHDGTAVTESQRDFLGVLFRKGRRTQAELNQDLSLSQQSISRVAATLEEQGMILRGAGFQSGTRGQPSAVLSLNPDYAYAFGLSLMADGIALTIVDFTGQQRGYLLPGVAGLNRDQILNGVQTGMNRILTEHGIPRERVFGLGVATTGFRVGPSAIFNTPPSLEAFALTDLEVLFSKAFSLPVWAENDGKAATIGELMNGVGRWANSFAYYFIATGVGGGFVMDGKLITGSRGNAGEFVGILPIDKEKYPFPNLELLRQHLNANGQDLNSVSDLVTHYDDSWKGIDDWIEEVSPSLSLMASATTAILDNDAIVLGGRIPKALALRLIPHIEFFDIKRRAVVREHAKLVPRECEGDATAIGAGLVPFVEHFFNI